MDRTSGAAALASVRLPFLVLTPACVVLGAAVVFHQDRTLHFTHLVLILVGALAAHVAVNALNEYHDFKSGLDFKTQRTPFSGGSGYLEPAKGRIALVTGVLACAVTALIGFFFVYLRGWGLLPLGLFGLLVIVAYTRWLTRSPLLCLIAPGLGFGTSMVMGTEFALAGRYTLAGFIASLVPFFLVSDLLLLNQFPDVGPDREVGRRHLPIAVGLQTSAWIYTIFLAGAYAAIVLGYLLHLFPLAGFLGLATVVLAVPTVRGVFCHAESIPELIPHMGRSVVIIILTPVLLAVGLFVGG